MRSSFPIRAGDDSQVISFFIFVDAQAFSPSSFAHVDSSCPFEFDLFAFLLGHSFALTMRSSESDAFVSFVFLVVSTSSSYPTGVFPESVVGRSALARSTFFSLPGSLGEPLVP